MRALIQWATATPSDWVEYQLDGLKDVQKLPKKPLPDGSEVLDDEPGWIQAINIQGMIQSADHVGFAFPGAVNGIVVGIWNDDAEDWPAVPFGWAVLFEEPAPDPNLGIIPGYPSGVDPTTGTEHTCNTVQTIARFADREVLEANAAAGQEWAVRWLDDLDGTGDPNREKWPIRPWSDFPSFNKNEMLHGVWVPDELNDSLIGAQTMHGWLEWVP